MNTGMSPKQVVEILEISNEALKKYSLLLEKHGLEIKRNHRGHRQYYSNDVETIKALIFLNKEKSVNLEDAAAMVTASDFDFSILTNTSTVTHNEVTTLHNNGMPLQNDTVIAIVNQLQIMKSELEQRDLKAEQFQQIVTERLEDQRDLIVAQEKKIDELMEMLKKENKKTFWQKLFGN